VLDVIKFIAIIVIIIGLIMSGAGIPVVILWALYYFGTSFSKKE